MINSEHSLSKWEVEFKKGFAKPLILLILSEGQNYPYNITRTIFEMTKGQLSVANSNIYPMLKDLKQEGMIEELRSVDSRRVHYRLTHNGSKFLTDVKSLLSNFVTAIRDIIDKQEVSGNEHIRNGKKIP